MGRRPWGLTAFLTIFYVSLTAHAAWPRVIGRDAHLKLLLRSCFPVISAHLQHISSASIRCKCSYLHIALPLSLSRRLPSDPSSLAGQTWGRAQSIISQRPFCSLTDRPSQLSRTRTLNTHLSLPLVLVLRIITHCVCSPLPKLLLPWPPPPAGSLPSRPALSFCSIPLLSAGRYGVLRSPHSVNSRYNICRLYTPSLLNLFPLCHQAQVHLLSSTILFSRKSSHEKNGPHQHSGDLRGSLVLLPPLCLCKSAAVASVPLLTFLSPSRLPVRR